MLPSDPEEGSLMEAAQSQGPRSPAVSIVLEWDNPRYTDGTRARAMLRRLGDQVRETRIDGELLVVYDELEVERRIVEQVAEGFRERAGSDFPIKAIPTRGLRYYDLKNEGARHSIGEIILFVDSDVLPENGWLAAMVGSFADPAVKVVNGLTYVELETIHGRGFGLHWYMFPPRPDDGPMFLEDGMWANSVAFRRHVFERFPYPENRERFRGQCGMLSEILAANGIHIWQNPSARVAHPAPPAKKFLQWTLCNGHDQYIRLLRMGDPKKYSTRALVAQWMRNIKHSTLKVFRGRSRVGLPVWAVPLTLVIAYAYYTLVALGGFVARWKPDLLRKRYGI
jgi:glycosyltransferase involved in cell wall biosynthesis